MYAKARCLGPGTRLWPEYPVNTRRWQSIMYYFRGSIRSLTPDLILESSLGRESWARFRTKNRILRWRFCDDGEFSTERWGHEWALLHAHAERFRKCDPGDNWRKFLTVYSLFINNGNLFKSRYYDTNTKITILNLKWKI